MDFEYSEADLRGLSERIRQLPEAMATEAYGRATFAAAQVVAATARRLAPRSTHGRKRRLPRLKDSVKAVRYGRKYGGVYVRDSAALAVATLFVGRWVEFGTDERFTAGRRSVRSGVPRGQMRKRPFIVPAAQISREQAFQAAVRSMERDIPAAVRKVKREVRRGDGEVRR